MSGQDNVIFREVQRFRQPWLWITVGGVLLLMLGIFGYGMIKQFVFDQPFGDNPTSDTVLAIIGSVAITFGIGLFWLFYSSKLITEVRDDGVYVRFFPFHRSWRCFRFDSVVKYEALRYCPIKEYGGWGIRLGSKGKAYNVSGDLGVRLDFSNGRHLLIGSQRPEELAEVIEKAMERIKPKDGQF